MFERFSQTLDAFKGEEASIKARNEAGSDGHGGIIGRIWRVLKILARYRDKDPDWYSGSTLSTIISGLRDVSLFAVAIVLAAYVMVWKKSRRPSSICRPGQSKRPHLDCQPKEVVQATKH